MRSMYTCYLFLTAYNSLLMMPLMEQLSISMCSAAHKFKNPSTFFGLLSSQREINMPNLVAAKSDGLQDSSEETQEDAHKQTDRLSRLFRRLSIRWLGGVVVRALDS